MSRIALEKIKIDSKWVQSNLIDSIHINYKEPSFTIPPMRRLQSKEILFSPPIAFPLKNEAKGESTSNQILKIILSKSVRRGKLSLIEPFLDQITEKINLLVENQQPISFILPTLPFKDQSPFVTGAEIDHVDLGEYAFFAQLKRITEAIKEVYTPGAHITLLCDGYVYAEIFANNDKQGAGRYKANCEKIKNQYGLYNEITLFDMKEVFFDFPQWKITEKTIQETIRNLYQNNLLVKERLNSLAKRFIFHVAIPNVSYSQARKLYSKSKLPAHIQNLLVESAIKYSSLHLTLKRTDLINKAFPSAIRCTVHPKAAPQIPLHLTNPYNHLLPYNGVATVSKEAIEKGQNLFQALRIKRLCEVLEYRNITPVIAKNLKSKDPIYYEIS